MPEITDTKNHPTIKALIAHQERLADTDALFARRYISASAASWSLLKSGTYPAKDPAKMLERCETALRTLDEQAEREAAHAGNRSVIVDLPHVRATLAAIKRCYGEPQNRLIVVLAPSGGGKSTLARRITEHYRGAATTIEATESWRGSYFYALAATAEALGIPDATTIDPRRLEATVFDELARTPRTIVIDEGHYLGPPALNLLKGILNKTETRIVLAAIPQLWERMEKKAYEEVLQLRRRTAAKIVVLEVTRDDCRRFLNAKMPGYAGLNGDEKKVVEACCIAANRFGLFDTLSRICCEIGEELGDGGSASVDLVAAAIKRVEALRS